MSAFPKLKTGAVIQYPARRGIGFSTHIVRFLDGSEQRSRLRRVQRRRWIIRLELLDSDEIASLESFFLSNQGQSGSFEFVDPWDDVTYPDCSLETGVIDTLFGDFSQGETTLIVKENEE
jgi:hypothetical protein